MRLFYLYNYAEMEAKPGRGAVEISLDVEGFKGMEKGSKG